jgi:hypothetical protein
MSWNRSRPPTPFPQPKMTSTTPLAKTPEKKNVLIVFSQDLLKYFEVSDGLAEKPTEEQAQYYLEVKYEENGDRTRFNLRWRFIEDRCDASDSIVKSKNFQTMCSSWSLIKGISSSSSFAANLETWEEQDEE